MNSHEATKLLGAVLALAVSACGQEGRPSSGSGSGAGGKASATVSSASSGSGGAGGVVPDPVAVKIMDWNVHNLLNDKNDSDAPDEQVQSAAAYAAHKKAVGAVIAAIDPDIAVLAEVENQAVLDDLDASELAGAYPHTALVEGNDPRGIDVAVLSKLPLGNVVSHKDEKFAQAGRTGPLYRYARDCLEVHLTVNGRELVLLAVHFKAKTDPDNPLKRLAEAQHTREVADALVQKDPALAIVVLGDYNEVSGSAPYLAIAGMDPNAFVDAADSAPAADRWTFTFNGKHELIDHQMANPLLYERLDPSSVEIRHGTDVKAASDHAPIMATYQVN